MQTVSRVFAAPLVSASIAYGIGRYVASSHIMGASLAGTVIINAFWVNSRSFDHILLHEERIKLAFKDACTLGKGILVMTALVASLIDLPVFEIVKILAISAFLLFCMINYSRICTRAKNLNYLRRDLQPAAERMLLQIQNLNVNQIEKEYHLKFIKSVKPTIDHLILMHEQEGYDTCANLCDQMYVTGRWILKHDDCKNIT